MLISAVFIEQGQVDAVKNELKSIGINEKNITVKDFAREELQDTLKEEYEEMSFNKEELGIFMDVRRFMPPVDVIENMAGLILSVKITPEQRDEIEEMLDRHQPQKVMLKDQ